MAHYDNYHLLSFINVMFRYGHPCPVAGDLSAVDVAWQTANDSLGVRYNIYRSTSADELGAKLNDTLISTEAGASNAWTDTNVEEGATYYFTTGWKGLEGVGRVGSGQQRWLSSSRLLTAVDGNLNVPTAVTMSEMSSGSAGTNTLPFMALVGLAGFGVALRRIRKR